MDSHSTSDQTWSLEAQARCLLQTAVEGYDKRYGMGSMSCSIYDTAWVSLVKKPAQCEEQWLFPESFRYLLETQSEDGSWGCVPKVAQIDGILSTAAALISLRRHQAEPLQLQNIEDLPTRIFKALKSLRSQLSEWCVEETTHVGFEVIVPRLLEMLEEPDIDFPGSAELERVKTEKLSKFYPELLYGPEQSTILHSLEAFIGMINFDKVAHHKLDGSMMCSPSSTAAYLMNASHWDDEAEAYLRHVIYSNTRFGFGGVPSAYPSTYFEYSWILSTLLRSGFSAEDLDSHALAQMIEILTGAFNNGNGVIGFAPNLVPDLDDSAKCITALSRLNQAIDPTNMIKSFETATCFKTYPMERDYSFSANCNALAALLCLPDADLYSASISKITKFLCDVSWRTDDQLTDKWNLSYLYPSLLQVEAFVDFLASTEKREVSDAVSEELTSKVAIILFRTILRALLDQDTSGSWNRTIEETSYGILILCEARKLSFVDSIRDKIDQAIIRGVNFLRSDQPKSSSAIWVEKVTFSSAHLSGAYEIAALRAASVPNPRLIGTRLGVQILPLDLRKQRLFLQQTPLFNQVPEIEINASVIEGKLIQRLLQVSKLGIFPSQVMEQQKYLDLIPLTWTSCNNITRTFASPYFIYEMIVLSFLAYQVDEFMESIAGSVFQDRTDDLRQLIKTASSDPYTENRHGSASFSGNLSFEDHQAFVPLDRFIGYVLGHPSTRTASSWNIARLHDELRTYLLAQVMQEEDNALFRCQPQFDIYVSAEGFFQWVRTTASDHSHSLDKAVDVAPRLPTMDKISGLIFCLEVVPLFFRFHELSHKLSDEG